MTYTVSFDTMMGQPIITIDSLIEEAKKVDKKINNKKEEKK